MRLLIVDDGHYIVEYVKHLLDWNKLGITHIQTTTNPLEARNILESTPVDILLTDIRMPEISGIELLKWIYERRLTCKVIFLSGYSDFEYARSALRYGAEDYLLKPVNKEDMERTIVHVVQSIKDAGTVQEWPDHDWIGLLLTALEDGTKLANSYTSVLPTLSSDTFVLCSISNHSQALELMIQEFIGKSKAILWTTTDTFSRAAGLLPIALANELKSKVSQLVLSSPFRLNEKNRARSEFIGLFYNETISLSDSLFLRNLYKEWPDDSEMDYVQRKRMDSLFLRCTTQGRQILFLLECISRLYTATPNDNEHQIANWLFFQLAEPRLAWSSMWEYKSKKDRVQQPPNQDVIAVIQTYILNHLNEALNLKEIGGLVHLHPVYLSKYYKQETGENLSDFLLAKRLEKATQLLKESSLHIVDISLMVGYKKPQYFIKIFKEKFGVTPYQYRRNQM